MDYTALQRRELRTQTYPRKRLFKCIEQGFLHLMGGTLRRTILDTDETRRSKLEHRTMDGNGGAHSCAPFQ